MQKQAKAFIYAIIVTLGGFIFGLDASVISGTVRFITKEFGLNDMQVGTVVSAPGFGVLFALLVTGWITNHIGRKKTLILIAFFYLVSALTSALAPSYRGLVAARFLGGLAFCSLSLASMYIGEIAPAKWRGKLVSINQMAIVVGLSSAYFVNYFIMKAIAVETGWVASLNLEQQAWRYMLGSEIIPALIWLLLLFFIPESPRWLVYRGRLEEAKRILHKITPDEEIEQQVLEVEESMHHGQETQSIWSQVRELLSPRMRTAVIVGTLIALVQGASGINAVLFYAPTLFEQLGAGTDAAFAQATWVGVISMVSTFMAILLIDRIGRRPMVIWGLIWLAGSLLICSYGFKQARYELPAEALQSMSQEVNIEALQPLAGIEFKSDIAFKQAVSEAIGEAAAREHEGVLIQHAARMNGGLILVGILSFIAAFQFSIGPVMWVLFSEIFPTALRGVAIPVFAFICSVMSWLIQKFFPWQLANMGGSAIFLFYASVGIIGLIGLWFYLPETKNMTIEEIESAFEKMGGGKRKKTT